MMLPYIKENTQSNIQGVGTYPIKPKAIHVKRLEIYWLLNLTL
jgi:hypothetical protein